MAPKKKKPPLPELSPGNGVIDTHCHLDMLSGEEELGAIIYSANGVGVKQIITVGIDLQSSQKAVQYAEQYPGVYATIGVHPHNVASITDSYLEQLIKLAEHPKVVAYGEIGLDFVKMYAPKETQLEQFEKQVEIAKDLELPLVIHDREAHDDILHMLKKFSPFPAGGVMHCFSGELRYAEEILALGFYISIPGVVTFNKTNELQKVVQHIPLASILIETDAPFLAPVPMRGRKNKPDYLLYTVQKIAELKEASLDTVARITSENAVKLFLDSKNN
jgi:TatD DNase family protein